METGKQSLIFERSFTLEYPINDPAVFAPPVIVVYTVPTGYVLRLKQWSLATLLAGIANQPDDTAMPIDLTMLPVPWVNPSWPSNPNDNGFANYRYRVYDGTNPLTTEFGLFPNDEAIFLSPTDFRFERNIGIQFPDWIFTQPPVSQGVFFFPLEVLITGRGLLIPYGYETQDLPGGYSAEEIGRVYEGKPRQARRPGVPRVPAIRKR